MQSVPYREEPRTATQAAPNRSDGSRTITITPTPATEEGERTDEEIDRGEGPSDFGVLRLRGGPVNRGPRVQWEEGTIDNEFLNRKKSKICCIYHKPKPKTFEDPFAESSSSDSSSDEDESDADEAADENADPQAEGHGNADGDSMLPAGKSRRKKHKHDINCSHAHPGGEGETRIPRNAYEHQPRYNKDKKSKGSKTKNGGSSTLVETL